MKWLFTNHSFPPSSSKIFYASGNCFYAVIAGIESGLDWLIPILSTGSGYQKAQSLRHLQFEMIKRCSYRAYAHLCMLMFSFHWLSKAQSMESKESYLQWSYLTIMDGLVHYMYLILQKMIPLHLESISILCFQSQGLDTKYWDSTKAKSNRIKAKDLKWNSSIVSAFSPLSWSKLLANYHILIENVLSKYQQRRHWIC